MSKFPRPSGSSTPESIKYKCSICGVQALDKADLDDHCARVHPEDPPKERKERKPHTNKERDLLIEAKSLLDQLQSYKAFYSNGRTTGKRIKELLTKIEEVLE